MIDKGATDWDWGLQGACRGGHLSIAQLMIDKGATEWDAGLEDACYSGHLDLVQLMIEKGATDRYISDIYPSNINKMVM
jgi:ankyrin repeat protein